MTFLNLEEIIALHERVLLETGGLSGVRDLNLLLSIIEKPKTSFGGKEMYPSVFDKAAVILESFVNFHVFADGNKRTAFVACCTFLGVNGWHVKVTTKISFDYIQAIAAKRKTMKEITEWLEKHSEEL